MSFDYAKYFGEITLTHDLLTRRDRILGDPTPCMAANGVDPDRARGLIVKRFSK